MPEGERHCVRCDERAREYDRRWDKVHASGVWWNQSHDDPWWRAWLTSRELFQTFHQIVPARGQRIGNIAGGDVFDCYPRECGEFSIQVWISATELLVAYPTSLLYSESEGLHAFEDWVYHLRHSKPLNLGRARDGCSYGAIRPRTPVARPVVKWAQAGDLMALGRNWFWQNLTELVRDDWQGY
jgi:hypothetical protein